MKVVNTDKSLRRYQIIGFTGIFLMVSVLGGWSAMASIHGAVVAPAVVMVESYTKRIQSKDGGIVRDIKVRDGDRVEAGQELVVLDDTDTRSELGIVNANLREYLSRRARLEAQRDGAQAITWPEEVLSRKDDPDMARIIAGQTKLFETTRAGKQERKISSTSRSPSSMSKSAACPPSRTRRNRRSR